MRVRTVVLSFGLNNRSRGTADTLGKYVQNLRAQAATKFPNASIYIPKIPYSLGLPEMERARLDLLNRFIGDGPHIPAVPTSRFATQGDQIHWTQNTALAILTSWRVALNCQGPSLLQGRGGARS